MDEKLFESAIDAIYEAATDPDSWTVALDRMSRCFDSSIATIIDRNVRTQEGHGVAVGVDAASQIEFFSVWGHRNPFVQALVEKAPRAVDTDQNVMLKSALLKSDYYNGFMKQRDMHAMLRMTLLKDDDHHQSISIMSPRSRGEFEAEDVERCAIFVPHLRRVAKVSRHLTVSSALLESVHSALDLNPAGIILLDRNGRILVVNQSARKMASARDGFVIRDNRVSAIQAQDNAILQRMITAAAGRASGLKQPGGDAMRIKRADSMRDYLVVVTSLSGANGSLDRHVPAACMVVNDPTQASVQSPEVLKKFFGLTLSEARIAERLANGDTPAHAAKVLGIAVSTARTHIDSIYRKTEVDRQADLVRLLVQLPRTKTPETD